MSRTRRHIPYWSVPSEREKTWDGLGVEAFPMDSRWLSHRRRWVNGWDKHWKSSSVAIDLYTSGFKFKRGWKEYQGRWAKNHGNRQLRRKLDREILKELESPSCEMT